MFLLLSGRHVGAHPDGHQPDVSIQISINLDDTLLQIARELKVADLETVGGCLYCNHLLEFIY